MMLKKGVKDKEAATRLGHSDINMTKKYQHMLSSMEDAAADILNSIVSDSDVKMSAKPS
jgi:site-specific recombinase XerD